jgi:uncharacterized ferritin-like protein (DUF455 family)
VLAPKEDTVERWAWDYIHATDLHAKIHPAPVPDNWESEPPVRRLASAGRPPALRIVQKAEKTRGLGAPTGRARALHTFFHHELQAAELMAWALLAFPETPREFKVGLVRIARDEARHMALYQKEIERLGHKIGDFTVRDWFWERVPTCPDPASFVAVMGLGLESANLEHAAAYAARFRQAGDERSAEVQEVVGREEIAHVRFGARWFQHFTGELSYETWRRALPPPLSPLFMRGANLQREIRLRAGFTDAFLDALDAWQPE